jgi:phosphoribosyl-AMP cyclohydrolase
MTTWLDDISFDDKGLVTAIALDAQTNDVLMVAWMNQDSLVQTVDTGIATYWSRSRQKLWAKGESSGHTQEVLEMRLDCDGDVITLKVNQIGGIACHTGRKSCLYRKLVNGVWEIIDPVLKSPEEIYGDE